MSIVFLLISGSAVGDPINCAAVIVGHEQGAVGRDQHVNRPAPDAAAISLARHPADREVLGLAGVAAGERNADDLIADRR